MTREEIAFFDRLAPQWDDAEILSTPEHVKEILNKLPIGDGMDVLDLGTGTGVLVPYLHLLTGGEGSVTAVDISDGMLSLAIKKFGKLDNVKFLKIDFEEESIPGKYNVIMLYSVYPHLHHPRHTLSKLLHHNLKKDGIIIIAFPTDENFINNIHKERKAESDLLPSAQLLAERINQWGMKACVVSASPKEYIVAITG